MSRKVISILLAVMLAMSALAIAVICVSAVDDEYSASERQPHTTVQQIKTQATESTQASTNTGELDSTSPTESKNKNILNLTVNATSNFFPETSARYNPDTNEVIVTYEIRGSRNLLDTQWYITYDTNILKVSDKNSTETISPMTGGVGVQLDTRYVEDEVGYIKFSASNMHLYDITSQNVTYATIIFDVKNISKQAPVLTTVDLVIDVLRVSSVSESGISDSEQEVLVIDNEVVHSESDVSLVDINTQTYLSDSTYVEPTTAEPVTEPTDTSNATPDVPNNDNSEPNTEVTESGVIAAPATNPTSATGASTSVQSDSTPTKPEKPASTAIVQTGDASLAIIMLVLFIAATCVMFVMRKREMYF